MLTQILGVAAALIAAAAGFTAYETARIDAEFPANGRTVAVAGGRLHYTERDPVGASRGSVLLIHGASGSQADLMLPLGDKLAAQGFRVIAMDRPGLGWSDRPDGAADASPKRQGDLMREAMQRLGVKRAIVVAHSLAGAMGAELALDHPQFTEGLVLLSPVTHPWPGGVAWYYHAAGAPMLGWLFTRLVAMPGGLLTIDAALKGVFAPRPAPSHYAQRTAAKLILTPTRFRDNAQDVLALESFVDELAPRLPRITAPTAIVTGDADSVVSPQIHSFTSAREIPGAQLTVLHGVGHSPHWANPEVVVNAIVGVADRADARLKAAALPSR